MRIALDARTIYRAQRRGTGKNLIDLYRALAAARPDWSVIAFHREAGAPDVLLPSFAEPRRIEMLGDRLGAWERVRLPMAAWRGGADLLHCPANTCPAWMPIPTLVTIHDLIPLDLPDGRPLDEVSRFAASVRNACRRAAWIVTPSAYTRERLVAEFGADKSRITVNPWPADSSIARVPPEEWAPVLRRYEIVRRCVLHFGAADPRKNTLGLIEAWAQLPAATRRAWQLVVVGLDKKSFESFGAFAQVRGVAESIVLHGFAPEGDISTLLSAADLLAFPSLSEGYGLPILDAWATRTAVLTSDCTSLPEVAGDAALLVDPHDPADIARGLRELMGNAALRAELVRRGAESGRRHTWRAAAERFARCVELAAEARGSARSAA
jgi:glycosyltransferase involved in cell wall biosynthesis